MAHKKSERKREMERRQRRRKKVLKARRKEWLAKNPNVVVAHAKRTEESLNKAA